MIIIFTSQQMRCFFPLVSPKIFYLSQIFCSLTTICLVVVFFRRRQWHPTPVLLPRESHGWRSLVGCSPWGLEESDTTERLHFQFSPSCIGEGNGSPLQCSFPENPRDGGACWAAVYGVTQSRTRLKRLSSSNSAKSQLQHTGSLIAAGELLVVASGIQFPNQGSNPGSLHQEHRVLATGSPEMSFFLFLQRH